MQRFVRFRKNDPKDRTPEEDLGPPAAKVSPPMLSPDQKDLVASKKLEAQAKLWAKKLHTDCLGPSWMKVLAKEFDKPYFKTVCRPLITTEVYCGLLLANGVC